MPIQSCRELITQVKQLTEMDVLPRETKQVLKEEMGMRFRRIQKVPLHLNSQRNLILRQQWAIRYLELIQDKIFLNIDESWLSESCFLRRKWRMPGDNNSVPIGFLQPRISIVACLDSNGNLYLTLSQGNSNSTTMEVFFHHLAAKLDKERPKWRANTVLLMDNAKYHNSS